MKFSSNIENLGTETAFKVSMEANSLLKNGKKIYPFHLGDINMKTPKVIRDATSRYMNDNKNGYCPSEGVMELREVLAEDIGKKRSIEYDAENVVIQPGGKPTIWKFLASIMEKGDEVLYPNPGYPIYESQINYQGGVPIPYNYIDNKNSFVIDIEKLQSSISKDTIAIIYNNYQNPTGASSSRAEMEAIANICIENDLWVLSDEAYYEIRYSNKPPISIASFPGMKERTVILYTFSKRFAMTGWRIGASIGPKTIAKHIAKFNINDESCTNHFIQCALASVMDKVDKDAKSILDKLKDRRDTCVKLLNSVRGLSLSTPDSTFYLYLNVGELLENKNIIDIESFRKNVLKNTGVAFCTRNHFGSVNTSQDENYIRLAYSGINSEAIKEGLIRFKNWIEN
tara:strand:- start:516 stop:1712 length:1197 start_codon:yes stop_codon:yes gene_type:complete